MSQPKQARVSLQLRPAGARRKLAGNLVPDVGQFTPRKGSAWTLACQVYAETDAWGLGPNDAGTWCPGDERSGA